MTLPIIQALWIGERLSRIEQLSIISFLKNGHAFHLYTYQVIEDVPEGTIIKDANEILPEKEIFKVRGGYAIFSDYFRWKLLYEKGGFYVDLDVICLKPFVFKEQIIFGFQNAGLINNAALFFPAKHKICLYLLQKCEQPVQKLHNYALNACKEAFTTQMIKNCFYGLILFIFAPFLNKNQILALIPRGHLAGPGGFTKALKKFHLEHLAQPIEAFYAIGWEETKTIFDNTYSKEKCSLDQSYAIHLWNDVIKAEKIDKNNILESSLFGQLEKRYLK